MMLEVSWDGLWTLSFGLSQFHGHGSWLVCEVALIVGDAPVQQVCWQKDAIERLSLSHEMKLFLNDLFVIK